MADPIIFAVATTSAPVVTGPHGDVTTTTTTAHAEVPAHGAAETHADPSIGGVLNATVIVSLAMLALIGIMLWKKVPAMIGRMLDGRIDAIKAQLDDAAKLRAEAEALRGEYQAKLSALDSETADMRARAQEEADALVAKAQTDAEALVARRQTMAEQRITAAERAAVAEVRATASRAAVGAAQQLIASGHGAASRDAIVDRSIADLVKL